MPGQGVRSKKSIDKSVLDYLERAEYMLFRSLGWVYGPPPFQTPKHDHILEIAKMIQREQE